jgi:hypothetical protein
MDDEPTQPCPVCDQTLRVAARACPSCGQDLRDAPSAIPLRASSDTAAWVALFTQPGSLTPVTEPLLKPLWQCRSLSEILASKPRTIGEAAFGIADMLGLRATRYHRALRGIVEDLGIDAAWTLALEVMQLPPAHRRQTFLKHVRRKPASPDGAWDV